MTQFITIVGPAIGFMMVPILIPLLTVACGTVYDLLTLGKGESKLDSNAMKGAAHRDREARVQTLEREDLPTAA